MTDVLAERFAALADAHDDSDWLDVLRRARRRRFVLPVALVAAAVVAAGAVAASGHWTFTTHAQHVTATTNVSVGGKAYRVSLTTEGAGVACFTIAPPGRRSCAVVGSGTLTIKDGNNWMTLAAPGPPFHAVRLRVPGGQIIAGASIAFARRIAIYDAHGRVYSTQTVAAPRGTKTPFRVWAIGLKGTTARVIVAYDARGREIRETLSFP